MGLRAFFGEMMETKKDRLAAKQSSKTAPGTKKVTASDVVLFAIVGLLFLATVVLVVGTLLSIKNKRPNIFSLNLLKNLIYIILTAGILTVLDIFMRKKKLTANEFTKIFIYLSLFLVVNVFNVFNLYSSIVVNIFAYLVLGVLYSIIGISIYYNYLKNSQNQVRAKANMVFWFGIALSVTFAFALEFLKFILYLIIGVKSLTINAVMLNVLYSFIGALITNIVFFASLLKTKKLINYCLIDVNK